MDQRSDKHRKVVKDSEAPESPSRRALLTSGAKAMPVVLTLQSGAALAQSSNTISAASPYERDSNGNTLCLDTRSVYKLEHDRYDMGMPAQADVNVIRDRKYRYVDASGRRTRVRVAEHDMCRHGGTYAYRSGGWKYVELPRNGVVVSATSLVSVSVRGHIDFNRIG